MPVGRSVVFERAGLPLTVRRMEVPEPRADELLVRVDLAGVCGTDPHRLAGDVVAADGPVCFGHEGVGTVVALGSDAIRDRSGLPLDRGDRVYWFPPTPCEACATCLAGAPLRCEELDWPASAAGANRACFQELALLTGRTAFHRVPDHVSSESVVAFGCAMPTAVGGFERLGPVPATVVVQGAGPVGLASVVLAAIGGADRIVVLGDPAERLDVATRLGATDVIPLTGTTPETRLARVRELTGGGADAVIEAAGHPSAFPEGFDMLGVGGRFLIMGLYSGAQAAAPIDPVRINNLNLRLIGSAGMPVSAFGRAVEIAAEYGDRLDFAGLITHRFPLEQTEEAIRTTARGASVKTVVVPGAPA